MSRLRRWTRKRAVTEAATAEHARLLEATVSRDRFEAALADPEIRATIDRARAKLALRKH
jgi:hypothetical protein